jgi:GAF domain-containing protein
VTRAIDPTLQAITESAVRATGASQGWLLGIAGERFVVLGAAGGDQPGALIGRAVDGSRAASHAAGSGQPFARLINPDEITQGGAGGIDGVPSSVLCAACGADDVVGVIELVDKSGGFEIADIETVTLLAEIAGIAIVESSSERRDIPSAEELAAEIRRLANEDPMRYDHVASAIQALLGQR